MKPFKEFINESVAPDHIIRIMKMAHDIISQEPFRLVPQHINAIHKTTHIGRRVFTTPWEVKTTTSHPTAIITACISYFSDMICIGIDSPILSILNSTTGKPILNYDIKRPVFTIDDTDTIMSSLREQHTIHFRESDLMEGVKRNFEILNYWESLSRNALERNENVIKTLEYSNQIPRLEILKLRQQFNLLKPEDINDQDMIDLL